MRPILVQASMAVLLAVLLFSSVSNTRAAAELKPDSAGSPYDLINAVNALRASYGLAPYSINSTLMAIAQQHADYMAATGIVSHTGLGGTSVTDRLLAAGYPLAGDLSLGGFRSENITSLSETRPVQDAVTGWTGDAPHLTTMISPNLTEIGAGVSINGGRAYYVIDCALPTNGGVSQPAAETAVAVRSTVGPGGGGVMIPVEVVTPNADGDVIHEVKAGQTLWQIAISYDTKIDELKRLNNLYDNSIYPGERLLIRQAVIVTTTTGNPIETATLEAAASPTISPTQSATLVSSTATATASSAPISVSTNKIMSIAIGVITLAVLSVLFVLGDSKKPGSKNKE